MASGKRITRRQVLRIAGAAGGTAALAACGATPTPQVVEKVVTQIVAATPEVVKETVVVKETQVVKETVVVQGPTAQAPAAAQPVTLRLQNWFSESDMWAWQIGLDKVKAKYPEIDVKLEFCPYDDTAVKIMAQAAAGNVPDLIMASNEHTPILSCSLLLLDLNPFIDKEPDVNPDDFSKGVAQGFNMWGHWWGFPYDQSTYAVFYNKQMFDDAGVPYPPSEGKQPWSWDKFVETAVALTKPEKQQWGAWYPGGQYLDSCMIYSAGGRNFDDQLRNCIIASKESADGLQAVVDLMHKHKAAPTPAETAGGEVDYFASGLAAMHIQGQWDLQAKNAQCNFPFDIAYLPILKNKRGVTGGSGFCISASTTHRDEAWKWLKEYTSKEVLSVMVGRTGRGIPARWSATPAYLEAGGRAKYPSVFIEQLDWAFNDRSVVAYYEFIDSYNKHLEPIFSTGQGDILAALDTIQTETNKAMDEKWASCKIKT